MHDDEQAQAVRRYLAALHNPQKLTDPQEVAALRQQLATSDDALERLELHQHLADATAHTPDDYEDAFVTHAKAWATTHQVSAQAFLDEGVPPRVLQKAGFRGFRTKTSRRRTKPQQRVRREQVHAALPDGAFTVAEVQQHTGASPETVRTVLRQEVALGRLREIGPDPAHQSRGRAPVLYSREVAAATS